MKHAKMLLALILPHCIFAIEAWAWNDEITHQDLSEKSAEHSVLSPAKGDYLKNLGFEKNLTETFAFNGETRSVKDWIRHGSLKEDAGNIFTAYYYNHFHNPLLSWEQAGLSFGIPLLQWNSSLIWAQIPSNPWTWQRARESYFQSLTPSAETQRSEHFAKTFKGLGHIIHLLQDAAQPAHVRNDPHPLDDIGIVPQFEYWAKRKAAILGLYDLPPIFPMFSLITSVSGYVPITQFWDTDQYAGSIPPTGTSVGITEYTNANFFSEDTIFAERLFPHPAKADTNMAILEQLAEDGVLDKVSYVKHNVLGHRLAAVSYFRFYDPEERLLEYRWYYQLDDAVYADYASFLIPRAVGYSAALINYFFRGEVEVSEIEEQRDANGAITGLKFKVKNLTPDEEMKDGEVWIAYRYKVQGSTEWTYGLSQLVASGSLPYQSQAPYEVSFPTSGYIPSDATEIQYTYVFKGTLGAEQEAVVGKVIPSDADIVFVLWSDEVLSYKIRLDEATGTFQLLLAKAEIRITPFKGLGNWENGVFYLPSWNYPEENFYSLSVRDGKIYGVREDQLRIIEGFGTPGETRQTLTEPVPEGYRFLYEGPYHTLTDGTTPVYGLWAKTEVNTSGSPGDTPPSYVPGLLLTAWGWDDGRGCGGWGWLWVGCGWKKGEGESHSSSDYLVHPLYHYGGYFSNGSLMSNVDKYSDGTYTAERHSKTAEFYMDGSSVLRIEHEAFSFHTQSRTFPADGDWVNYISEMETNNSSARLMYLGEELDSVQSSGYGMSETDYGGGVFNGPVQHTASGSQVGGQLFLEAFAAYADDYVIVYTKDIYQGSSEANASMVWGSNWLTLESTQKSISLSQEQSYILTKHGKYLIASSGGSSEIITTATANNPPDVGSFVADLTGIEGYRSEHSTVTYDYIRWEPQVGPFIRYSLIGIGRQSQLAVVTYVLRDSQTREESTHMVILDLKNGKLYRGSHPPIELGWDYYSIIVR